MQMKRLNGQARLLTNAKVSGPLLEQRVDDLLRFRLLGHQRWGSHLLLALLRFVGLKTQQNTPKSYQFHHNRF